MTRAPSRARCPTCKREVETAPEKRPREFPFCSERCRLLDLHRWFSEDYRIPAARPGPPAEEESPS
jgi:endogenous inhibitor of DNA gyrase (YacG/DUF329 family)